MMPPLIVRSLKVTMGWLLELLSELTKKIVRQLAYTKPNNKLQQRDKEKIQKIPGLKFTANSNTVLKNPRILGFCQIKFLITLGPVSRCCWESANWCSSAAILAIWNHPQHLRPSWLSAACHWWLGRSWCALPSRKPTPSPLSVNLQLNIAFAPPLLSSSPIQSSFSNDNWGNFWDYNTYAAPRVGGAAQGGPIKAGHDPCLKGWGLAANQRDALFSKMSQP